MSRKEFKHPDMRERPYGEDPEIRILGMQFKSATKVRKIARALDMIEVECGMGPTRITIKNCFVCPDIDWKRLKRTPMQKLLARILEPQQ